MPMPAETADRVKALLEQGDASLMDDEPVRAIASYTEALSLLPADSGVALALRTAIGEAHVLLGELETALNSFRDALDAPGGVENPLLRLRLGQTYHALGRLDDAADEFLLAHRIGGPEVFEGEDDEYLDFLAQRLNSGA